MTENKPRLLDQVKQATRVKHYSLRTEEPCINWIKRFIFFHNKKHPVEMGEKEIGEFITQDPRSGVQIRHHLYDTVVQKEINKEKRCLTSIIVNK